MESAQGRGATNAVELLDAAVRTQRLSLGTLCEAHRMLAPELRSLAGRVRQGPTVVRLGGNKHFVPPAARDALSGAAAVVAELNRVLGHRVPPVSAVMLAADTAAQLSALHPFPDGNGRLARAVATVALLRSGYRPGDHPTFGEFFQPIRCEYFQALRKHDLGEVWIWRHLFHKAVAACCRPPPVASTHDTAAGLRWELG
jgi:Fic family protein